ncbi:hypothetical protein [Nautilia sp.]
MKAAKWIIAGFVSYAATFWIKNLILNITAGIIIWYASLWFLDKFLEGGI